MAQNRLINTFVRQKIENGENKKERIFFCIPYFILGIAPMDNLLFKRFIYYTIVCCKIKNKLNREKSKAQNEVVLLSEKLLIITDFSLILKRPTVCSPKAV